MLLGKLGQVGEQVESRVESMGQRFKLKLQHANRERLRAESEARQSREAMTSLSTRTDAAIKAHEAREELERRAREEAENRCQQLTLDLEWQKHSLEQVRVAPAVAFVKWYRGENVPPWPSYTGMTSECPHRRCQR